MKRLLTCVGLLLLLVACDTYDENALANPLLWRAEVPDGGVVYFFGSIHAGPPGGFAHGEHIMYAFYSSDYLAVEVDTLAVESDLAIGMEMMAMLTYPMGRTIHQDIGEDLHARASEVLYFLGIPEGMYDGFVPLLWSQFLLVAAIQTAGLSADYGVDVQFMRLARQRGMDIIELEGWRSQMEAMLSFSMPLQVHLLESGLDVSANARDVERLTTLWAVGDADGILRMFDNDDGMPADLHAEYIYTMLTSRDREMTEIAYGFLRDGKNVFFVVGLAHLIGEASIIARLEERGVGVSMVSP